MEEIQVTVKLAKDGSGWMFNDSVEPRKGFLHTSKSESWSGKPHVLIPLSDEEKEVTFEKNVREHNGEKCLIIPNVTESYITY